jgi:hypothetical protein
MFLKTGRSVYIYTHNIYIHKMLFKKSIFIIHFYQGRQDKLEKKSCIRQRY